MPQCSDCNREFFTPEALHAHCRDKADHVYCEDCERLFVNQSALQQHLRDSPIHREDVDDSDDHAHCRDKADHVYCEDCERLFVNQNALQQHLQDSPIHREDDKDEDEEDDDEPFCSACARRFVDKLSLYQHLSASSKHNWCFVCSRDFVSASALDQHSSSRVHKIRDLTCPLCSNAFKIPSAIALHIESGACHNIHRHQVTAAIHSLKVVPTISISHRLQGATSTPAANNVTTVHYSATEQAFDGSAYQCYLCHRKFRTLVSLNAHLNSPAHDADEFKCPKCKKEYKLISGLIQHIESEACGMARFEQVEDHTNALTAQFARLLRL